MSKIPLSKDFSISANTISPAGTALNANGLVITQSPLVPVGGVKVFGSALEVGNLLGVNSKEYQVASLYFSGYDNSTVIPGSLLMTRSSQDAAPGFLTGGSLQGVSVATMKSLSGTISLSVNSHPVTSEAVDFSTAQTMSDIAAAIEKAIANGVSVSWLAGTARFVISTKKSGEGNTIDEVLDSEVATGLKITASTGATSSPGINAMTLTQIMNSVINQNQDWIGFMSVEHLEDDQNQELCAWANSQKSRYFYSFADNSEAATVSDNSQCFMQKVVAANDYASVFAMYGSFTEAVLPLAWAASLDFSRTNGRVSFKFRQFSGVKPLVNDLATAQALESNGYNYYGAYGLNKTMANYASEGSITGQYAWLDSFVDQVWIRANLISAFANLFTANVSFPFNDSGYAALSSAVIDVATTAKNFGAIRAGVTLDQAQITQINATTGRDIKSALFADGWYFFIPSQTGTQRLERKVEGAVFFYVDGQVIQSVQMSATDIL